MGSKAMGAVLLVIFVGISAFYLARYSGEESQGEARMVGDRLWPWR